MNGIRGSNEFNFIVKGLSCTNIKNGTKLKINTNLNYSISSFSFMDLNFLKFVFQFFLNFICINNIKNIININKNTNHLKNKNPISCFTELDSALGWYDILNETSNFQSTALRTKATNFKKNDYFQNPEKIWSAWPQIESLDAHII